MTIREMHYDFKKKFNKVDSQKNRNLLVPEIDWALNEAEKLFVKLIAYPRLRNHLGFETTQRSIEDIRTVVVKSSIIPNANKVVSLPSNYEYYLKAQCTISKSKCLNKKGRLFIYQHDDMVEESKFYNSSFEWREVVGQFTSDGIQLLVEDFTVDSVMLHYIRERAYMHNAQDYVGGTYTRPSGVTLISSQNCELPSITHSEIVDIAVAMVAGEIQTSDFQVRMSKIGFNQIV